MVCDGVKLARCADDARNRQNGQIDPAGASPEAMAQGDPEGEEEAWDVDDEFENGNAIAVTNCHCEGSSGRKGEKGVKALKAKLVN